MLNISTACLTICVACQFAPVGRGPVQSRCLLAPELSAQLVVLPSVFFLHDAQLLLRLVRSSLLLGGLRLHFREASGRVTKLRLRLLSALLRCVQLALKVIVQLLSFSELLLVNLCCCECDFTSSCAAALDLRIAASRSASFSAASPR